MALSTPLVPGNTYQLSFWAEDGFGTSSGIEVGLSSEGTSFGALVYTAPSPMQGTWTNFVAEVVATSGDQFLTVRNVTGFGYNFVDNFELTSIPGPGGLGVVLVAGALAARRRRE